MILKDIIIPSKVARPGMKVQEVFNECVARNLPGLPYCDENGVLTGRVSVKHVLSRECIPQDVWRHAHLLGDDLKYLTMPKDKLERIMNLTVEGLVIPNIPTISSRTPLIKALALIEQFQSSYVFVVDDGHYLGSVTLLGIVDQALKQAMES